MNIKLYTLQTIRNDSAGLGHFGAPRGGRTHNGIDFAAQPGSILLSPVSGIVTKLGYCYSDDLSWRYVEITDNRCPHPDVFGERDNYRGSLRRCSVCNLDHFAHRFFYVKPLVDEGDRIVIGAGIGEVQDISERYSRKMTPHVHYEVKQVTFYLDPDKVMESINARHKAH